MGQWADLLPLQLARKDGQMLSRLLSVISLRAPSATGRRAAISGGGRAGGQRRGAGGRGGGTESFGCRGPARLGGLRVSCLASGRATLRPREFSRSGPGCTWMVRLSRPNGGGRGRRRRAGAGGRVRPSSVLRGCALSTSVLCARGQSTWADARRLYALQTVCGRLCAARLPTVLRLLVVATGKRNSA